METRALLCPGAGAQYVGMGKELYDTYRVFQEYFEEASDCLQINMVKLCFASADIDIVSLEHGPYILFLIEAASSGLLRTQQIPFYSTAGLDLTSWYSAVHGAGAISVPDGLYMLRKWVEVCMRTLQERPQRSIMVESGDPEAVVMVTAYAEQVLQRSALMRVMLIATDHIILTGDYEGCSYLEEVLQREQVAYRLHTDPSLLYVALSDESIREVQQYLEKVDFHEPLIPVLNPLRGSMLTRSSELHLCAGQLFAQPLRLPLVVDEIQHYPEIVCTIPSHKIRDILPKRIPGPQWWFMETHEALRALRTHAGAPNTVESE